MIATRAAAAPASPAFSCFVTGTDTGVGKSLVAAALLRLQAAQGRRVVGMKPVAAGAQQRGGAWHNEDVELLAAAGSVAAARADICPCLLEHALAPHIAAELAGVAIDPARLLEAYARLRAGAEAVVVEGVGGFRVPLAPGFDTADLAAQLGLPVLLVVGLRLGCLNHALLTAEAIAARGLPLAGWVANHIDPRMAEPERNRATLARLLPAPCLGVLPFLEPATPDAAVPHLDIRDLPC